ncbi:hypothetical protein PENTCL1PPCAC_17181 [Pristionchus entomophagus]|uniref:Ion channel n=1 Tax=Pristionchus entomophagus TaxID=358040 RepID=A0AAV5TKZ9_9BILA|nr:hypothetical protein PENTCL1PPCAC_17181 [Pristionchus entomophagus]
MVSYRMNYEDGGHQANGKDPPAARLSDEPWSTTNSAEQIVPSRSEGKQKGPWFAAWCRETRIFIEITAMHGVKRVWISRAWSKLFWGITVLFLFGFLTWQLTLLVMGYLAKPVVSDISFVMADDGLAFPKITICSYNPMKKSYVKKINKTGDFSMRLARYMLISNNDVLNIFGGNDEDSLIADDKELQEYKKNHPGFSINSFYHSAGFECEEVLKLCSFAGREFNCCDYSTPILSELGLCQVLNLQASPFAWMRKQTEATETAGLQIILDAHMEEVLDVSLPTDKVFNVQFENGFKFYLEEPDTTISKTSQGITVSPGDAVYTSVSLTTHELLDTHNWGVCISEWPDGYNMTNGENYESTDCQSQCKAKFFYDRCNCSPFMYNFEEDYRSCTPLEVYRCTRDNIVVDYNQTSEDYVFPECKECVTECKSSQYSTFNSYGRGFAEDAINALMRYDPTWTEQHIKENFLSMNVFYREMAYTSYVQVQAANVVDTLSNMGGTMGLFLGMSVLTVIESIIYLAKVLWLSVCCPRKRHVAEKEYENRKDKVETREAVAGLRSLGVDQLGAISQGGHDDKNRVIELRISVEELRKQLGLQGDTMMSAMLISSSAGYER